MHLLQQKIDPLLQAAVFFGVSLVFMLFTLLFRWLDWFPVDRVFPWSIATAFLLLYAVFSSLMSLTATSGLKYWGRSVYGFAGLALADGVAAWLTSGLSLGEAQSYRWIYVVIAICFLVFLSIVNLMRKIVSFAEKEEWNAPRRRRR